MTPGRIAVEIQEATSCKSVPAPARLRAWARAALAGAPDGEITVRIVDEEESADLNLRYRHRPGATNVLAFGAEQPLPLGVGEAPPIGDLVVCAPVVAREAAAQNKSADAHWAHIIIHGCLHLMGYDHNDDLEARSMEARERELLAGFGFSDPYGEST